MIQVKIEEKDGHILSYEITGHAAAGEQGHDIVCAAVSVLGITTANNLHKLAQVHHLDAVMDDESGGFIKVKIPFSLSQRQTEQAQLILACFKNAMEDVAVEYSEYIEFVED